MTEEIQPPTTSELEQLLNENERHVEMYGCLPITAMLMNPDADDDAAPEGMQPGVLVWWKSQDGELDAFTCSTEGFAQFVDMAVNVALASGAVQMPSTSPDPTGMNREQRRQMGL